MFQKGTQLAVKRIRTYSLEYGNWASNTQAKPLSEPMLWYSQLNTQKQTPMKP